MTLATFWIWQEFHEGTPWRFCLSFSAIIVSIDLYLFLYIMRVGEVRCRSGIYIIYMLFMWGVQLSTPTNILSHSPDPKTLIVNKRWTCFCILDICCLHTYEAVWSLYFSYILFSTAQNRFVFSYFRLNKQGWHCSFCVRKIPVLNTVIFPVNHILMCIWREVSACISFLVMFRR